MDLHPHELDSHPPERDCERLAVDLEGRATSSAKCATDLARLAMNLAALRPSPRVAASLLVAQRVDGIEPRGLARRVEAEEDPDRRREAEG